jgi:GntR family transcriptional regulator
VKKEQILFIAISATNPDPMYKQVTDQIRDAIVRGSLASDARLPSIREMAGELKISHITIKRAYGDLEREGYIITRPGLGSFVAGMNWGRLREKKLEELRKDVARLAKAAETFGITAAEIRQVVNRSLMKRK